MRGLLARPQERAGLWFFKIITGIFIIVVLGIHFVVNHLVAPGGLLSYADVIAYYAVPIIPVMEIVFLILVVAHAFIGLRSILLDLNLPDKLQRIFDVILILSGVAAVIYGVWLVLVIASKT
jgi:succinate dehydrogenase hydrophobic anchor subunit